jgi:hypothetical protein
VYSPYGLYSPFFSGWPTYWPAPYGTPNYTGPLYPSYDSYDSYDPDDSYVNNPPPPASNVNDLELVREIQRLTDEVNQLRQEPVRQPGPQGSTSTPATPTVLVFRDGHREEAQSYAVMGQTLWVVDENGSRRVDLGDINLDQTRKENQQRGVRFLPGL